MHIHQHHCVCKHLHIQFCEHCNKPYCLDCGKEWTEQYTYQYGFNTTPSWVTYTNSAGTHVGDAPPQTETVATHAATCAHHKENC
jgi:hypothetical protein